MSDTPACETEGLWNRDLNGAPEINSNNGGDDRAEAGGRAPTPSPFLTSVRGAPARLLHPLRRRHALQGLRSRPAPTDLLVVCHGNLCRSPFAAALLGIASARTRVRIESAGFVAPNRPCPREAVAAAARRGVDLSDHRSKPLTADLVGAADLIVVMEPAQQRVICDRFGRSPRDLLVLGDLDPAAITTRAIRDPLDRPGELLEACYRRIERCVAQLVCVLGLQQS